MPEVPFALVQVMKESAPHIERHSWDEKVTLSVSPGLPRTKLSYTASELGNPFPRSRERRMGFGGPLRATSLWGSSSATVLSTGFGTVQHPMFPWVFETATDMKTYSMLRNSASGP